MVKQKNLPKIVRMLPLLRAISTIQPFIFHTDYLWPIKDKDSRHSRHDVKNLDGRAARRAEKVRSEISE